MEKINCTQIYFDSTLKEKKVKSGLSWKEAVEIGINQRLKDIKEGKIKYDIPQ